MNDQIGYSSLLDTYNVATDDVTANNLVVTISEQFTNLNPSETVVTNSQSFLTTIPYATTALANSIVKRDSSGDTYISHLNLTGLNNQLTFFNSSGGSNIIYSIGSTPSRKFTLSDPFADCNILTDQGFFTINNNWNINQDWTYNAVINSQNILPNTTTTYTLGNLSKRYSTSDVATGYFDQLDSRNSNLSSNKNFLPSINNTYNLGSSTFKWKDQDLSGSLYTNTISTRSGTLVLNPANTTIQAPCTIWENKGDAGGGTTTGFPTNQFICSNSDGHYSMYWGVYNGSGSITNQQRGVIQMYDAVSFTGLPMILQPNGGSQSKVVIGEYDATAQSTTQKLYCNGTSTFTGILTNSNTTDSLNTTTGSMVLSGGLGVGKTIYADDINTVLGLSVGTVLDVGSDATIDGNLVVVGTINANVNTSMNETGGTVEIGNTSQHTQINGNNVEIGDQTLATGAVEIVGFGIKIQGNTPGGVTNNQNLQLGSTTSTTQNVQMYSAKIQFRNNITSSVRTELNVNEAYTLTSFMSGPWLVKPEWSFYLILRGDSSGRMFVDITWDTNSKTAVSGPAVITADTALPTRFIPAQTSYVWAYVRSNSVNIYGHLEITTGGILTFYTSAGSGQFANTGTAGIWAGGGVYRQS